MGGWAFGALAGGALGLFVLWLGAFGALVGGGAFGALAAGGTLAACCHFVSGFRALVSGW